MSPPPTPISTSWANLATVLHGRSILITGATGFIGTALLQWLATLNHQYHANVQITGLARRAPQHAIAGITYYQHDLTTPLTLTAPHSFDYVIHGANPVPGRKEDAYALGCGITQTTIHTLNFIAKNASIGGLLISSGAASTAGAVDFESLTSYALYGLAKATAEALWMAHAATHSALQLPIARGYAFSGAYLSPSAQFALCQFVESALRTKEILLTGNPQTTRTYLDSEDMARWLLWCMCRGTSGHIYNIGGATPMTMQSLAELVGRTLGARIRIAPSASLVPTGVSEQYCPDLQNTEQELGLTATVSLTESIQRMANYFLMLQQR